MTRNHDNWIYANKRVLEDLTSDKAEHVVRPESIDTQILHNIKKEALDDIDKEASNDIDKEAYDNADQDELVMSPRSAMNTTGKRAQIIIPRVKGKKKYVSISPRDKSTFKSRGRSGSHSSEDEIVSSMTVRSSRPFTSSLGTTKRSRHNAHSSFHAYASSESDSSDISRRPKKLGAASPRLSERKKIDKSSPEKASPSASGIYKDLTVTSPLKRRRDHDDITTARADDHDLTSSAIKRRRLSPLKSVATSHIMTIDDDDSDPVIGTPINRRKPTVPSPSSGSDVVATQQPDRHSTRQTALEDDEEDIIRSSSRKVKGRTVVAPVTPTRSMRQKRESARRHRTEREKALELMKRQRAGEKIHVVTDTESSDDDDDDQAHGLYDSGSDLEALTVFDDEEEMAASSQGTSNTKKLDARRKHGKSRLTKAYGDASDLEDFVVDDDIDADIGAPDELNNLPLAFTHASRRPLKEHFQDAVEWMVHNKLNPAFERENQAYQIAFKRLDDQSKGLVGSTYISSAWTPAFVRALKARPIYIERKLDPLEGMYLQGELKCEPCNRRNHIPTFGIQFQGRCYNQESLEEVDQESSEEDASDDDIGSNESDSEKGSVDINGYKIVSQEKEWLSGV